MLRVSPDLYAAATQLDLLAKLMKEVEFCGLTVNVINYTCYKNNNTIMTLIM